MSENMSSDPLGDPLGSFSDEYIQALLVLIEEEKRQKKEDAENVKAIREKLRTYVEYDEGEALRRDLARYARRHYFRRNADKYFTFMNGTECFFRMIHPQNAHVPYVWLLDTSIGAFRGDCVEECLDQAIDAWREKNNRERSIPGQSE